MANAQGLTTDGAGESTTSSSFSHLVKTERVKELLRSHDRSFYAHFVFIFICVTLDLWETAFWVSRAVEAIALGSTTGILSGWIGQLGHDAGHGQAPKGNMPLQRVFQLFLGPVCLGFSSTWWINKHVIHHKYSNWEGKDGDLNIPLPFTANQARERGKTADSFRIKNARWIFPLILPLQAINARISSIFYVFKSKDRLRGKVLQLGGIASHLALYGLLLYVIVQHAGWHNALWFAAFHQGVHGFYNACVFATNHKGMPVFPPNQKPEWLDLQILTSRNVRVDWEIFHLRHGWILERIVDELVTWLYGGLNYQIEHHLFPTMPRANLRKVRPLVIEFCRQHGYDYYETGVIRSYREVLQNFENVRIELLDSPMGA